jgi:hypothetical protein
LDWKNLLISSSAGEKMGIWMKIGLRGDKNSLGSMGKLTSRQIILLVAPEIALVSALIHDFYFSF